MRIKNLKQLRKYIETELPRLKEAREKFGGYDHVSARQRSYISGQVHTLTYLLFTLEKNKCQKKSKRT